MALPPIGQPPEENGYEYLYASKAAVRIKIRLGFKSVLGLGSVLRLGLVSEL